jgi:hypothetical protein
VSAAATRGLDGPAAVVDDTVDAETVDTPALRVRGVGLSRSMVGIVCGGTGADDTAAAAAGLAASSRSNVVVEASVGVDGSASSVCSVRCVSWANITGAMCGAPITDDGCSAIVAEAVVGDGSAACEIGAVASRWCAVATVVEGDTTATVGAAAFADAVDATRGAPRITGGDWMDASDNDDGPGVFVDVFGP